MLIPKRQEIKNDLSFTKDEIKALKADNVVVKTNSKGERTLHQRDKDTNEIVSIKAKDIHIPQKLGGIELTPMQQEKSQKWKRNYHCKRGTKQSCKSKTRFECQKWIINQRCKYYRN